MVLHWLQTDCHQTKIPTTRAEKNRWKLLHLISPLSSLKITFLFPLLFQDFCLLNNCLSLNLLHLVPNAFLIANSQKPAGVTMQKKKFNKNGTTKCTIKDSVYTSVRDWADQRYFTMMKLFVYGFLLPLLKFILIFPIKIIHPQIMYKMH